MPANLTPDYERADQKFKAATTDEARIEALREMYATIPKHKGTEKMQADIKRRLSQLRIAESKKPSRGPDPFFVPRSGAGQVVMIGTPNVGKSLLVGKVTHAPVKVGDYPFTTVSPVPGMAVYEDAAMEWVDTPPVTAEHVPTGMWGLLRQADVLGLVVDAAADPLEEVEVLMGLMEGKGLELRSVPRAELDVSRNDQHAAVIIATKVDVAEAGSVEALRELYAGKLEVWAVSVETGEGLPALIKRLWELLSVVRVYTREPGSHADTGKPIVLPAGSTVEDLAAAIHQDMVTKMKTARLWRGTEIAGLHVHKTEELKEGDRVEIHM